jgi:hypothetical protein
MIISSAAPKELVDWFHNQQQTQRVLCVLLAPSNSDQEKFSELVKDLYATDTVLGEEVAFLLLHPGASTPLGLDKGYGEYAMLQGAAFVGGRQSDGLAYSLREAAIFRDMSDTGGIYRKEIASRSSEAMARFVPDFMKLFAVLPSDIPALCVIVKGLNESAVLPLSAAWTAQSLIEILSKIRAAADHIPNFREEYQSLADAVPIKIHTADDSVREIEAKTAKVGEILERLVRRYDGTELDKNILSEYIAKGCPGEEQLITALGQVSFKTNERFLNDGQRAKVLSLAQRVESVRTDLKEDLASRRYVLSLAERVQQLVEQRSELLTTIQNIGNARFVVTSESASGALKKVSAILDTIKLVGEIEGKVTAAIEWFKKLIS